MASWRASKDQGAPAAGHARQHSNSMPQPSTGPPAATSSNATASSSNTNYSSAIGEYLAPFQTAVSQGFSSSHGLSGAQYESTRLLADLAPHIMRPRIVAAATSASNSVNSAVSSNALVGFLPIPLSFKGQGFSLTQPARNLVRIAHVLKNGPVTSNDLLALENSHQILADAALSVSAGYADQEEEQSALALTRARQASFGGDSPSSSSSFLESSDSQVSLLRGFEATTPSAKQARERRRKERARQGPRLGLKQMGDRARGLLTDGAADLDSADASFDASYSSPSSRDTKRKERQALRSKAKDIPLSEESLQRQSGEVVKEKDDIDVRRRLLQTEVAQVELKMAALQAVKDGLTRDLLSLKEEELELDDEQAGIQELISLQRHRKNMPGAGGAVPSSSASASGHHNKHTKSKLSHSGGHHDKSATSSSRRRKGPMFLPSEHDELPNNVAFMTLSGHTAPITALDFSEPYGALVSAGADGDSTTRVWDLSSGYEVGRLRHDALVKALQVEDELCITGGADANIKIWDLRKVEDWETRLEMRANGQWSPSGSGIIQADEDPSASADNLGGSSTDDGEGSVRQGNGGESTPQRDESDPKLMTLEGHSKEVTALYFDDTCLVTGASDKTLRQWDLNTGQCVLTMDILWAISNPSASQALGISTPSPPSPDFSASSPMTSPRRPGLHSRDTGTGLMSSMNQSDWSGNFSYPTPPLSDGSWELYTDFVGSSAIQFWGYALASGSSDGAVRMWDMRTGQSHRTLLGHTAPVTTLQFDETYVISGSLDKSIRIWDLRTGSISETIKYDYPVTKLQFDSRKIMVADGKNGIDVFNRTTFQHSTLEINGHTSPVERLRYMDRYAVSGGKDAVVKVWAL
ncbi:unnamed protein product [Sympodiomycopsis kandeliae]